MIRLLDWDSDFFGYGVGQVYVQEPLGMNLIEAWIQQAKEQGLRLLYVKSALEQADLKAPDDQPVQVVLADKKVTFSQQLNASLSSSNKPTDPIYLYSKDSLDEKLLDLTFQSGLYSRFAVDPNFKSNEFKRLYAEWIRKSVNREIAKEVWVSKNEEQEIIGFVTLGIKNGAADIGLLAVDIQSRGKRIGQSLMEKAKNRAWALGERKLTVVTQLDNIPACSFYEKCGFAIEEIEYIYHIWL